MKVNGVHYRTVWMADGKVCFIEQNHLPYELVITRTDSWQACCDAIRTMQIRGAGAIGAMAGYALALACRQAPPGNFLPFVANARKTIEATRPTARNLFYATDRVYAAAQISPDAALGEAEAIANQDAADSRSIGDWGAKLISDGARVLTHCNAGWLAFVDYGTALSPIYRAYEEGKSLFVYADETRPRGQGARLTAWELHQAGIPHAIIPDNAAAFLMSRGKIDLVITGADRIARNGDTANKIGTLEKALCAGHFGIPFYIAAPFSTFDPATPNGEAIPIEERSEEEVLFQEGPDESGVMHKILVTSPGSHAINPAFDVTPARFITGFITEKGVFQAPALISHVEP